MRDPVFSSWVTFLEDIGVPPPSPPSPITVRTSWCPDGTKDPTRIKQRRPLLRNLLLKPKRVESTNLNTLDWVSRKSFKRLLNLSEDKSNPLLILKNGCLKHR